ncbi:STAS domain-containing protein [Micromonospora rifamycinica]|uniref:Anti-anti-sigma factor n=1 Tax=Micromonospora rifamycinica TaxID=291594 RepID=A0A1C5HEM9_9ACTN|nr:STAS domain-containing protein [Micromonospora rifamycinica]SCG44455.1 anti-anti-sigma factor [Micromonospora rifamycinica]
MGASRPECTVPLVEVCVTDDLDLAALARSRQVFDRLVELRPAHVVVDLSACRHLDAAAVGLLLDVHRQLTRHGGVLTLRDPSPRAMRVLSAARVSRVLPMVTTPRALSVDGGLVPPAVHRQPAPPRLREHSR